MIEVGLAGWRVSGAFEDLPLVAARVGAQRLQLDYGGHGRPYELSPTVAGRLARCAHDVNVFISLVAVNALNDLGITDPSTLQARRDLVQRAIESAAALNARALLIPAFRRSLIRNTDDLEMTSDFLLEIAPWVRSSGLQLVHENVLQSDLLSVLRGATAGSELQFIFDSGNLGEYGIDWRLYLLGVEEVLYSEVHIKDRADGPAGDVALGQGGVQLGEIIHALLRSEKVRCFVLETDHRGNSDVQIKSDMGSLGKLIGGNNEK